MEYSEEFKRNSARKLTPEEARAMGKRSGEARRQKRSAKDFAIAALNATHTTNNGKKMVVKDILVQRMVSKAIKDGDLNAVKYLFELIGEAPVSKQEVALKRDTETSLTLAELESEIARLEKFDDKNGSDEDE